MSLLTGLTGWTILIEKAHRLDSIDIQSSL